MIQSFKMENANPYWPSVDPPQPRKVLQQGRRGNEKSSFSSSHLELSNAEMRFSADSHNSRVVGCVIHPARILKGLVVIKITFLRVVLFFIRSSQKFIHFIYNSCGHVMTEIMSIYNFYGKLAFTKLSYWAHTQMSANFR